MPKIAKEFGALDVKRLVRPSGEGGPFNVAVGGVAGLMLQLTPNGGRSRLLRVSIAGKRRELGLGSYPEIALAAARDLARKAKAQIKNGVDPIEERKAARAELSTQQRRGLLFADALEQYCAKDSAKFSTQKYAKQWRQSLVSDALPIIGKQSVQDIQPQDLLQVLEPIWYSKNATAKRVRMRIEEVLRWATVAGHRVGDNPARWENNLKVLLPEIAKASNATNHAALQQSDAANWFAALQKDYGVANRALEMVALTAVRSGEMRGAIWDE